MSAWKDKARSGLGDFGDLYNETFVGFHFFRLYIDGMEGFLNRGQDEVRAKFKEISGEEMPLEILNPFLAHDYPRYFRYSFLALLISFAEGQLSKICVFYGKKTGLEESAVRRAISGQGTVKKCKKFLKKNLQFRFSTGPTKQENPRKAFLESWDPQWQGTLFLVKLRNCILHCGGDVSESRDKEGIRKKEAEWEGLTIEDNIVLLDKAFCDAAIKEVSGRFSNLFTVL